MQRCQLHIRETLYRSLGPCCFMELIFLLLFRSADKMTHLNPGPPPAIQPAPSPQPPLPPRQRKNSQNPWVMPWICQRVEKQCYRNLLVNLIQTDISDYQNFVRMPPAVFDLIEECIRHSIKKEVTNFRKSVQVGLKLAITLRYLATGERCKPLQHHWLVGQTTIYKFVPIVWKAILAEFHHSKRLETNREVQNQMDLS